MNSSYRPSRREFVGQLSLAAAATLALPRGLRAASGGRKKLGVALLGLGGYSSGQLAPALQRTEFCQLTGLISGTPSKLESWREKYGVAEKSCYSYDDMERIADDPAIDIVYVVTPPGTHKDFTIRAAKAGKHVICEKPMAPTVKECEEMIAACKAAGRKLSIGYRLEFEPHHNEMERLALDPRFGPFTKMEGGFGFRVGSNRGWRLDKELAAGGPLPDVGVYVIQAACRGAGNKLPVAVTARELPKTRPELFAEVEETIEWTMEFPGGATAKGWCSYNENQNRFRAENADGSKWVEIEPAYSYGGLKGRTNEGPMQVENVPQQALQMDDFARCVLENRESPVPGEMGRDHIAVMEAIYASAAQGGKRVAVKM